MSEDASTIITALSNRIKQLLQTHNSNENAHSGLLNTKANTYHTHGQISSDGTINSDITSINKILVTNSSNQIKTISQLPIEKFVQITNSKSNLDDGIFLYGENNDYILTDISATKDTVEEDEETQISVTLKRGTTPLNNKTIKFNDGINSFFVKTNNNGIASYTYTGSGRGTVNFIISYNTLLEASYEITDTSE